MCRVRPTFRISSNVAHFSLDFVVELAIDKERSSAGHDMADHGAAAWGNESNNSIWYS